MKEHEIPTPAYVCEERLLRKNLKTLAKVKEKSGAKVLVALKGFAFTGAMDIVSEYLDGAACSGLWEAELAKKYVKGEVHTYSPAFKDSDFTRIAQISNHVVFNSPAQWHKFKSVADKHGLFCGLRLNPQTSRSPVDTYNPCAPFSRLGTTAENLKPSDLEGLSGLHFHALCEESAESLEYVLNGFTDKFGEYFSRMKWINFGGGHHITRAGYNVDLLIRLVSDFSQKYGVQVYLEPGEAVGWQTGYLVSSVLDIVENGEKTAILDISAEAHMPDTLLMPYRPAVRGESKNGAYAYRFGGNTCLAGDVVGLEAGEPVYKFDTPLAVGDRVIFEDQIHYTIVKNTTFNGIMLPDLILLKENGEAKYCRKFDFSAYELRN
ncbi:carboxynorspermidine decarboxylase [Campylobacter sp. 19-13652]|uniref:carboxynorspermidine decarboxylase n=1 Tax=Campylobacter sp. 19-13652 TaxID=2840180 RepID=UPI001C748908|nr:carboxynorspermidine decarboxylase [Campylobacter sp. 19-13652]BCX79999.1 carboxynorspermidine/carboxyspermidine decarboxylase [Campylobacter sp. 19-13652]